MSNPTEHDRLDRSVNTSDNGVSSISSGILPGYYYDESQVSLSETMKKLSRSKETRAVQIFRYSSLLGLIIIGIVVSVSVYLYTNNAQNEKFTIAFDDASLEIVDKFLATVEQNLQASSMLSSHITSYALQQNMTFPFVTVPGFELYGSHTRTIGGTHIVHWMPFVTDNERSEWEEYALENRFHIHEAYDRDEEYRQYQDIEFGLIKNNTNQSVAVEPESSTGDDNNGPNETVLEDGTGYHPKIFRNIQGVASDEPEGAGPFMILWQRRYVYQDM